MTIQLYFTNPACVSASSNLGDIISIKFNENELLRDEKGYFLQQSLSITSRIGRLLSDEKEKETVEAIGKSIVAIATATGLVTITLNLIIQASLNQLLGKLQKMQIIVHIFLINEYCV